MPYLAVWLQDVGYLEEAKAGPEITPPENQQPTPSQGESPALSPNPAGHPALFSHILFFSIQICIWAVFSFTITGEFHRAPCHAEKHTHHFFSTCSDPSAEHFGFQQFRKRQTMATWDSYWVLWNSLIICPAPLISQVCHLVETLELLRWLTFGVARRLCLQRL